MVYVVLEEKGWGHLALGQCTDAGEVVAVIDAASLATVDDGVDREWRAATEPRNNIWAALVDFKRVRLESFGEPSS
jgi:hypothetical protein